MVKDAGKEVLSSIREAKLCVWVSDDIFPIFPDAHVYVTATTVNVSLREEESEHILGSKVMRNSLLYKMILVDN